MGMNQHLIRNHMFETLAGIKAVTNGREGEICSCLETDTIYKYVVSGSNYAQDNRYVLDTGSGGNTRWVGISGKYEYSSQLASVDNTNLVFTVDTTIDDGVVLNTQFQFATYSGGTYDFYINWGDGAFHKITTYNDANLLHTYSYSGIYQITIVGLVLGFAAQYKCISIQSFGKLITLGTFAFCSHLVSLPTNPYNVPSTHTKTPYQIFRECESLVIIDLSHTVWTSAYWDGFYEFCVGCYNAEVINMKGMIVHEVIRAMSGAFQACSKVEILDFSTMDISGWISLDYTFRNCAKLKYIKGLSGYILSNITTFNNAFAGTSELIDIDIDGTADFTSLTGASYMFHDSGISNALTVKMLDAMVNSPLTNMDGAFRYCLNLTTLDLSVLDLSAVTSISELVANSSSLTTLVITGADLGNVTNMYGAIADTQLTSVGLNTWNVSSVTNMEWFAVGVTINTTEYSNALIYWATLSLQTGVTCHMGGSKYNSAGQTAKNSIVATFGWTFTDGGLA